MERLSEKISTFRGRFNLSRAKASKALGVSDLYVRSLEEGKDVRTGLPFKPRESTLRQIALKMTEYAAERGIPAPVTYEELMVAAGYLTQADADFHQGKTPEPSDEQLRKGELGIPGLTDLAASSDARWDELSDDERRQVLAALQGAAKGLIDNALAGKRQKKLKL